MTTDTRRALVTTATAAYTANCALGLAVAVHAFPTTRGAWLHHLLYVCTCTTTAVAVAHGLTERRRGSRLLLGALPSLASIPYVSSRRPVHVATALTAAPVYVAAMLAVWRR